ncbi:MAG: glycoside hydrolase N-terminal domain-containing protein [Kiritimatiellae bacterium]|nr:glycoside hydrolase N-terminal domain-containing protein [Kiritimatiellia bacterium]
MPLDNARRHNLFRDKPTAKWIEGIPQGNGTLGVMAWGGPEELILSLDRNDLWCDSLGPQHRRFTAGALVLDCGAGSGFEEGLALRDAVAWRTASGMRLEWFVHAEKPVICLRILNPPAKLRFRWRPPQLWSREAADGVRYGRQASGKPVSRIANPFAGRARSSREIADGFAFMRSLIDAQPRMWLGVKTCHNGELVPIRRSGDAFEIDTRRGNDILLQVGVWNPQRNPALTRDEALRQLSAHGTDWKSLLTGHRKWWREFWSRSHVRLSNPTLERLWWRGAYQLGCCARPDSLPIALQGVWGSDGTPPWGGGYYWDLNVQSCYWPIYTGNHLDLGHSLYNWYLDKLPLFREYARSLFGAEGAALPMTSDLDGIRGKPSRDVLRFGDGAWVCHNFWQHFRYTRDPDFLRSHVLPVFKAHLQFARFLWRQEKDGRYHLNHACSPEIESQATTHCPCRDTGYDLAFGRFLAAAYRETIRTLRERQDDLALWAVDFLRRTPDYPTAKTTGSNYYWPEDPSVPEYFVEWPGFETQLSHRHFSHLMMLYPVGEIHRFSPYRQLRCAQNSLHMLILRGTGGWAGFSFPWASLLATRAAWPKRMPTHMLEEFSKCVVVPFNGITLNEDHFRLGTICQTGSFGPFNLEADYTLESSMIAMTAVQDMLLHAAGDRLVFAGGAAPELSGEFGGFRTPFGDTVYGRIENGRLVSTELSSDRGGLRHLALNDDSASWTVKSSSGIRRYVKSIVSMVVEKGEVCSAHRG